MRREEIAAALQAVPAGTVALERRRGGSPQDGLLREQFTAGTAGKGLMELYPLFPGIEAGLYTFLAPEVSFRHDGADSVLDLYYCRSGRIGWNMQGGTAVYLGAGDLSIHSADCCANSVMMFPLGYSQGISISVDLDRLDGEGPPLLRSAGLGGALLRERFCAGQPHAIPAAPELEHIFAPLCLAPPDALEPLLALKVQELLLYLARSGPAPRELTQYYSQQTELIREIHREITAHLDRRSTIEELAKRYLINTSTLKNVFKAVYGLPIATYMKEYRVRQAMELLRETDLPISQVAAQVGYATQGKFTQAFKDVTQTLPTAYRRTCRAAAGSARAKEEEGE